jgi:hypothetical protein
MGVPSSIRTTERFGPPATRSTAGTTPVRQSVRLRISKIRGTCCSSGLDYGQGARASACVFAVALTKPAVHNHNKYTPHSATAVGGEGGAAYVGAVFPRTKSYQKVLTRQLEVVSLKWLLNPKIGSGLFRSGWDIRILMRGADGVEVRTFRRPRTRAAEKGLCAHPVIVMTGGSQKLEQAAPTTSVSRVVSTCC